MMIKALIGVAVVVLGALGANGWFGGQAYRVTGYFVSAERVVPANDVVLGGVIVGRVDKVALASEDSQAGATITMLINSRYAPLHRGTQAQIRPRGQLGEMFVELTPGGGAPIPNGGVIPLHDTAAPVALDEINDIFDDSTRERIKTATLQGAAAFGGGGGESLNQLLGGLPAISANLAATTGAIDTRDRQLDELQVEFDRVATMWASEDQAFRGDLRAGASLLDTTASHQQNLQDQLVYANQSLAKINGGLSGHEKDLNRILKQMPGLLDQLRPFQDSSATAFSILGPCIDDVVGAIALQADAMKYQHPAGAQDGQGNMLRVDAPQGLPSRGDFGPSSACGNGASARSGVPTP